METAVRASDILLSDPNMLDNAAGRELMQLRARLNEIFFFENISHEYIIRSNMKKKEQLFYRVIAKGRKLQL